MRPSVVCAFLFLSSGCIGHAEDAHEPGDRLGTYHATGTLSADSCQAAVLGVMQDWQFDVKLSREERTLYWLNGQEAIPGTIASDDKSFSFESGVEVPLRAAQGARPGCVILRRDSASGKLSAAGADVRTFTVKMSFGYAEKPGTDCRAAIGGTEGFAALPCLVSYQLNAERTALPPKL